MGWNLSGELIETCSCDPHCPCWFGVQELMKMDQGWCDNALLFRVEGGESNGIDLAGRTVVVGADFPGPTLFDADGTARLYIDDGANEGQRSELEAIFQGKVGGPMAVLGGLMSKWLPTRYCSIEIEDDGDELTAKVGDVGEIKSSVLKNEAGNAMTMQHSGFAGVFQFLDEKFRIAPSGSRWADPDLPREFETRSGARGSWNWSVD